MTTRVYTHTVFGQHETPEGHAEQAGRYAVVEKTLQHPEFSDLDIVRAPLVKEASLTLAHDAAHVDFIRGAAPSEGLVGLDPDTYMGPHSWDAALRGAGGALAAVDAVATGEASNAFVASRPPGHHTVKGQPMGFCLFNNAALAALHGRAVHGLERVAVLDFDVHHGNGTQDILETDENAFFASSHEWPQYPGTGATEDRGAYGQCHNVTLATGDGSLAFRRAWGDQLLPALEAFGPNLIVISAGFDAHRADPLGGLLLDEADYAWVTGEILALAQDACKGRVVSVLEGGYDLAALGASVAAHVGALQGR